jgi:ABC-type nickel/cobalt efflux system permease component RcnA
MPYYELFAITFVLGFSAWLIFSKTKKIKRPNYTTQEKKYALYNKEAMLNNITQKEKDNIVNNTETLEYKEEHTIVDNDLQNANKELHSNKRKVAQSQTLNLKDAILGSNIIEKKKR